MKFRTEVGIEDSEKKIQPSSCIFTIGSCFATEIAQMLSEGQLQTMCNPFGTLFNPVSIKNAVQRLHDCRNYEREDLVTHEGSFISLDHGAAFDTDFEHKTLEKINKNVEEGNRFLQSADFVIITLGSSFAYEFLPKKKIVASCHKIPARFFQKKLFSQEEITESLHTAAALLKDICPQGVRIIFTVSPVRHTRDGMQENSLSKAKLITAVHEVISDSDGCTYLPAYEILNDDLRDYRFYKEDLVHPTNQAVNYIFEKFGTAYFSHETMDFVEQNLQISTALRHRAADMAGIKHQDFIVKLNERIEQQQKKVRHKIFADA